MKKIEHIGIAVSDIERSNKLFSLILGKEPYKQENVSSEKVEVSFFKIGESKIELLQANNEESPISKFINKKGEGMHHMAFEVDDIVRKMDELKQAGFELLSDVPKEGADNKLICFLHPKFTNGVLIELCQEKKEI